MDCLMFSIHLNSRNALNLHICIQRQGLDSHAPTSISIHPYIEKQREV